MVTMAEEVQRRWLVSRALQFVVLGAIVYFFVLPLIPGFRDAVRDLKNVDPNLLFVAIGLQGFSLLAYSMLTKAALGDHGAGISVLRLFRIQLSTKALGNIVPGGSAASTALGYRLITMCGVKGPDAAFALATAGVGSAVVLNFILWFGLIISIPTRGVNAAYGTAAIVGILLMAFAGFVIFGLVEGQGRSDRLVRSIARRLRFDEHHAASVLEHLGNRIEGLFTDRALMQRVVGWATLNWALDALSLWVFLRAFGGTLGFVWYCKCFLGYPNHTWRIGNYGEYLHSDSCRIRLSSSASHRWGSVVSRCTILATDICRLVELLVITCRAIFN